MQPVDGLDLQRQQDLEHADVQGIQRGVRDADADQEPPQAATPGRLLAHLAARNLRIGHDGLPPGLGDAPHDGGSRT